MASKRVYVATVAGLDPSGGAGLMADTKAFEMNKVYGFGVCSAMTWQNDENIEKVQWYGPDEIIGQLALLIPKFKVNWFKIGIIENWESLKKVASYIKSVNPGANIIWDPVIKASSGFSFFYDRPNFNELANYINIITPNVQEFEELIGNDIAAIKLSDKVGIYKKGGHNETDPGKDVFFYKGKRYQFNPGKGHFFPKHGSGCVFSATLCANFARGYPYLKACLRSKRYVEHFLASERGLLGWHKK